MSMLQYILDRLNEPSTWRGLVDFAMAAGVALSPEQVTTIVGAGMAFRAMIGSFLPDHLKKKEPQ